MNLFILGTKGFAGTEGKKIFLKDFSRLSF
jgi:hypothetical protein